MTVDAMAEVEGGVFIAFQVDQGGCDVRTAKGLFFWLLVGQGQWTVTSDLGAGTNELQCVVRSLVCIFCCL